MVNSGPNRLLAVRLSSLGDLVHTLPVVPALRAAYPEAQLDWLVDRRWSPLMKLVRGIDEVISLGPSVSGYLECMARVRQARYSCVIDFQGIYRSAILGWASGAKRRIGRDRSCARERGAARFYNERVVPSGRHVAEMSMSLAVQAGAQMPAEMQFPIEVPKEEAERIREKLRREGEEYIVVSPGGGWKSKCWPPERFGAICSEVWRRHGIRSVINIAPGEEETGRSGVEQCASGAARRLLRGAAGTRGADGGGAGGGGRRHGAAAPGGGSGDTRCGAIRSDQPRPERAVTRRRGDTELFGGATQLSARRLRAGTRLFVGDALDQRRSSAGSRGARDGQSFARAFAAIALLAHRAMTNA